MSFLNPTGDLSIPTLNVFNNAGTGLEVDTKTLGTTFNLATGAGTVDTTNGAAMFLDPLTGNMTFGTVTSTNATALGGTALGASGNGTGLTVDGLTASGGAGTNALTIATLNVSGAATDGVLLQNNGVGIIDLGNTTINGAGDDGVDANTNNSAIQFTSLDITNTTAAGIDLLNNTADLTFQGTTTVTTSGGAGLFLNGNSANTTFTTLTITDATGSGVDIDGGTDTVNFATLNVDGPGGVTTEGLDIVNHAGSVTVTGVGGMAGSGGTIQNITDDGVFVDDSAVVSLSFMDITGADEGFDANQLSGTTDITLNDNVIAGGDVGVAIATDNAAGAVTVQFNRNSVSSTGSSSVLIGPDILAAGGTTTIREFADNIVTETAGPAAFAVGLGAVFDSDGMGGTVNAGTLTINNSSGTALGFAESSGNLAFNTVDITTAGIDGIHLGIFGAPTTLTVDFGTATIAGAQFDGVFTDGLFAGAATFQQLNIDGTGAPFAGGLFVQNSTGSVTVNGGTIQNTFFAGVDVDNGANVAIDGVTISGVTGDSAVHVTTGANASTFALSNSTLSTTAGFDAVDIDSTTGAGMLTITNFANNTVLGNNGETGGIHVLGTVANPVIFDNGGAAVSGGNTDIGTMAAAVQGIGLDLENVSGQLDFGTLNVFTNGGTGVQVQDANKAANTFTLTSTGGTINAVGAPALFLDPLNTDLTFGTVTSTNSATGAGVSNGTGIAIDGVTAAGGAGTNALTIATLNVFGATADGVLLQNNGVGIIDLGAATINVAGDNGVDANTNSSAIQFTSLDVTGTTGAGIALLNNTGTFAVTGTTTVTDPGGAGVFLNGNSGMTTFNTLTVNNATGAGVDIDGGSDIIQITQLNVNGLGANASTTGLDIANHTGSLTISGSGAANSGGVISNVTGDGVAIDDSASVALNFMDITGGARGVDASTLSGTTALTINDSTIAGLFEGVFIAADNVASDVAIQFNRNTVSSTGASALVIADGPMGTETTIAGFLNNQVTGANGVFAVGIDADFDSDGMGGTVNGGTFSVTNAAVNGVVFAGTTGNLSFTSATIGSLATRVGGKGLSLTNVNGTLNFDDLDIFNDGGTGLEVKNPAANIFALTVDGGGVANATIDTINGAAVDIDPLTVNATFASISASGGVNGINLDTLAAGSSFTVSGTTNIANTTGDAIAINNNGGTFAAIGATTIDNAAGAGINIDGTGDATFASVTITNRGAGGIDIDGTSGTLLFGATAIDNPNNVAVDAIEVDGSTGGSVTFTSVDIDGAAAQVNGISLGATTDNTGAVAINGGTIDGPLTGDGINSANTDLAVNGVTIGGTAIIGDGIQVTNTVNATLAINTTTVTNAGGAGITVNGAGGGTTTVTSLNGNTVSNAGAGGILFETVTFDAGGGAAVAGGATVIGDLMNTANITGDGLRLNNVLGGINFATNLDISNNNGTGLFIRDNAGKAGTFGFAATGLALNTATGTGVDIDPVVLNVAANTITASGGTNGILLNTVSGTFTVSGDVNISNTTAAGIDLQNSSANMDFQGTTTVTDAGGPGVFLNGNSGMTTFATLNANNATGAGVDIDGGSDTIQITQLNVDGTGANASTTGLDIANHTGSLTISGTGAANSGGVISNVTGDGVAIDDSASVALNSMTITGGARGVDASTLSGTTALTINDSVIAGMFEGVLISTDMAAADVTVQYNRNSVSSTASTALVIGGGPGTETIAEFADNAVTGANGFFAVGIAANFNSDGMGGTVNGGTLSVTGPSGGGGVAFVGTSGNLSFTNTTIAAVGDGLELNGNTGTLSFGTTGITLGANNTARGIDYTGSNAATNFGTTTITGVGTGTNQVGIDFSGATLTGAAAFDSVAIAGSAAATDSIGVDLTGLMGNQFVNLGSQVNPGAGPSSSITGLHRGVVIDTTAAVRFTFGDGELALDTASIIDVNGLAGSFTVDAPGGTLAASSFDFEDVMVGFGDMANFPVAPGNPVFVSTAGGVVTMGTNGLSQDVTTITVAAAELQAAAGQTFVFVGDAGGSIDIIGGGVDGFTLDAGQSIDGFANMNAVSFGVLQPLNVTGNLGAVGGNVTGTSAVASNSNGAATTVVTAVGNHTIENNIFDGAGTVTSLIDVSGVGTAVTINGVDLQNIGAGDAGINLDGNTAAIMLMDVDLIGAGNMGTALQIDSTTSSTAQITGDANIDIGGTTGTVVSIGAGARNVNLGAANITADMNTSNVINITGQTGGTISFGSVAITGFNSAAGIAVNAAGTGGNLTFTELDITATDGDALAVDQQTLSITNTDNDIIANSGQALDFAGTTFNAGGVTFDQVTSNASGAEGIDIDNTAGGTLTVTTSDIDNAGMDAININTAANTIDLTNVDIDLTGGDGLDVTAATALNAGTGAMGLAIDGSHRRRYPACRGKHNDQSGHWRHRWRRSIPRSYCRNWWKWHIYSQ